MQHLDVCKKRVMDTLVSVPVMLNTKHLQAVRIMKITAFILLVCLLQVAAKSPAQEKITLNEKGASLIKIFTKINKQCGYNFLFTNEDLQNAKPVSIEVKNAELKDVLEICFKNQPFTYVISGKLITITPKKNESPVMDENVNSTNFLNIHGKVVDENGKPVPGVNVTIKGGKRMTITNENGEFTINGVESQAVLVFSSVNMEAFEIIVGGKTELLVKLKIRTSALDEVQIIAYGQAIKRLQTGNISTIKADDIEKQPVNNPLLGLEGYVPGLFITQNTGVPGGGLNIQIRGQNSIANGVDPLYIIDGVPYTSQLLPNLGGSVLTQSNKNYVQGAGNPLSFISTSDIESISVLKDADATAIYGSRGANGVILITTKKGMQGKTQVTLSLSEGIGKVGHSLELLNTSQYLLMREEAFKNDGEIPNQFNAPDLLAWDTTRYTDWQKKLIGGTGHYTDAQASVSGGNPYVQFLLGADFHKESTVFPGDFSDWKGSAHFNIANTSANQKFKTALSGLYLADNSTLPTADLTSYITLPPNAPNPFNTDGSVNWANSTWPGNNPYALLRQIYKARTNNFISNLTLSYQVLNGLDIRGSFGYTDMVISEASLMPISSLDPDGPIKTGTASFTANGIRSWIIEPQVTYKLKIGRGGLDALVGSTFQRNINEGQIWTASGYNSDALLQNIQAAPTIAVNSVKNAIYKYNAVFGRLNYNFQSKYIVNFTARRDGSSRFGENNRFHDFGSIGAGWIFSQERFFPKKLLFLSFGKLRMSFGSTGSDQIGDYSFYDLFNSNRYSYQGTVGLTPGNLFNPDLAWEKTKKLEAGMDLGFAKDRYLINIAYYSNRSSNQLLSYTLPTVTGFPSIPANFPANVQNAGWEFFVNTTNFKTNNFTWTSSVNFTIPRNKLISFPNLVNTPYQYSLIVGQPISIVKVFHLTGVNDSTGSYEFKDSKGQRTYFPVFGTDNLVPISTAPKFYGGLGNTLNFKGFQLDILVQFTKQMGISDLFQRFMPPGGFGLNEPASVLNRWQNPNENGQIQKFTQSFYSTPFTSYVFARQSDYAYTDASFIRLKNLSLSYQLPNNLVRKMHFQNLTVYLRSQNLITITKYKGIDPESQSLSALPPLRIVVGGIKVTL